MLSHANAQEIDNSFKFLYFIPDAYNNSLSSSDLAVQSSGALFQNISSMSFARRGIEIAAAFTGESLFNNILSVYSIFDIYIGKMGVKTLLFLSKDEYLDSTIFDDAYRGIAASLSYAFRLNRFLSFIPFSLSFGLGVNYAGETVIGETVSSVSCDTGMTAEIIENRFFAACSMNNAGIGLSGTTVPAVFNVGIKHYLFVQKALDIIYTVKYSPEEFRYNSVAFGIAADILKNYSIRAGYKLYIKEKEYMLNNTLTFGLGIQLFSYILDISFIPVSTFNTRFDVTLKYYIYTGFKKLTEDKISRMEVEKIIRDAYEAIEYKEYDYAFILLKTGLLKDPSSRTLIRLFEKISEEKEEEKKEKLHRGPQRAQEGGGNKKKRKKNK
ncbi:hypothetical protein ACFL6D_01560 [Spirochaetota bacterium]